jgi:hypothetical protein
VDYEKYTFRDMFVIGRYHFGQWFDVHHSYASAVYQDWRHPKGKWPICLGGDTKFGWWLGDMQCKLGFHNVFCRGRTGIRHR